VPSVDRPCCACGPASGSARLHPARRTGGRRNVHLLGRQSCGRDRHFRHGCVLRFRRGCVPGADRRSGSRTGRLRVPRTVREFHQSTVRQPDPRFAHRFGLADGPRCVRCGRRSSASNRVQAADSRRDRRNADGVVHSATAMLRRPPLRGNDRCPGANQIHANGRFHPRSGREAHSSVGHGRSLGCRRNGRHPNGHALPNRFPGSRAVAGSGTVKDSPTAVVPGDFQRKGSRRFLGSGWEASTTSRNHPDRSVHSENAAEGRSLRPDESASRCPAKGPPGPIGHADPTSDSGSAPARRGSGWECSVKGSGWECGSMVTGWGCSTREHCGAES
jgi:hypothetical protein